MNSHHFAFGHARGWGIATMALAAALVMAGCGDKKKDKPTASQTAAKVNKEEITVHQINYVLQQQRGLKQEQAESASRQILERLIDQQVALEKAEEQKLDRDPRVAQAIEAAKRDIIARAFYEKTGEQAAKPSDEDIRNYYNAKPALFKDRRIYSLQEVTVESKPEQMDAIGAMLKKSKSATEFAELLKAADFRFAANQAVRAAEQLPLNALDAVAAMKDGQAMLQPSPNGATAVFLVNSRTQAVDEVRARPAIEAFLLNERKRAMIEKEIKTLRAAAKVEYVGKFAEGAASAPPAAPPAAAAPAQAASDASALSKGLQGLK